MQPNYQERLFSCSSRLLAAIDSLSSHVSSANGGADLDIILETIVSQEEKKLKIKIERLQQIRDSFDSNMAQFQRQIETLEESISHLEEANRSHSSCDVERLAKNIALSVVQQLKSEVSITHNRNSIQITLSQKQRWQPFAEKD